MLLRSAGQPELAALAAAVAAEPAALAAVAAGRQRARVGLASLLNVLDLSAVVLGGLYAQLFDASSGR